MSRPLPHSQRAIGRLRPLREHRRPAGTQRPACDPAARDRRREEARPLPRTGQALGRPHRLSRKHFRDRHRLDYDLPGLQARALHRLVQGRRRGHGDGRDRGHLQLLRAQAEDRHRPLAGTRASGRARRWRSRRARDHGGVRLPDARPWRRAPPDRRVEEGRQHHLRRDAQARQQGRGRTHHRWRLHRHRAGRPAAGGQWRARGAHARGLWLGHDRHLRAAVAQPLRRSDRGRRPHHRRADRAPGRQVPRHETRRHPGARPQVDAGPLLQGGRARPGLGRHQRRGSAVDHRQDRREDRVARDAPADGVDHGRGRRVVRA